MLGAEGMMQYELHCGNSKELLKTLEDNSIDSIVTDPPYELGFMGKKWDASGIAYDVELWRECLRVLKPGGHLLAFSGSRTYHRMTVAIEDAGFDIRDQIMWLYGSGFPKSHDVSKAMDKMAGAEREVVGTYNAHRDGSIRKQTKYAGIANEGKNGLADKKCGGLTDITAPATDAAKEWNGWGTALKPAHEPICVARKPLIGTVAENVLTHGTGGINVDGCRVHGSKESYEYDIKRSGYKDGANHVMKANKDIKFNVPIIKHHDHNTLKYVFQGRWPANIIHDGSADVLAGFPETQNGGKKNAERMSKGSGGEATGNVYGVYKPHRQIETYGGDKGSAARFFYCAKASKKDRDEGLEAFEEKKAGAMSGIETREGKPTNHPMRSNHHPTVKPTNLMQYLCRLVTPPNGLILDPFLGSGSTGKAAMYEGFRFIGFDLNQEYIDIAKARIEYAIKMNNESSVKKENTLFEDEE
jgi:site-specific DNA-methyltransferase (adenine-specific)